MVASLVNDLVVLCPNAELGCPITCARYLLGGHLREDCQFVAEQCSGCEDVVLRKDAAGECLHQVVECGYCGESFRKLDMEVWELPLPSHSSWNWASIELKKARSLHLTQAHENECPQIIAQCPHCDLEFTRSTITSHEATCPSAIIPCIASDVGCPYSGPRKEAPEHTPMCAFTLLRPLLQAHSTRLATLELENRALRKKIDILLPPRSSSPPDAAPTTVFDDQTIQLLTEQEHLRGDIERLSASLGEMEIKQSMLLMNETLRTKEEMAGMRAAINGMRMQMHWLLTVRLQSVGAGSTGGGQTAGAGGAGAGVGGGAGRRLAGECAVVGFVILKVTDWEIDPPGDRVKL